MPRLQQLRLRFKRVIRSSHFRLMLMSIAPMLMFGCKGGIEFTGFCLDECGGGGGERGVPGPSYIVMSPKPQGYTSPSHQTAIMFAGDTMVLYAVLGYQCVGDTLHTNLAWRITDTTAASMVRQADGGGRLVARRPGGFRIQMARGNDPIPETWAISSRVNYCSPGDWGYYDSIVVVPRSSSTNAPHR